MKTASGTPSGRPSVRRSPFVRLLVVAGLASAVGGCSLWDFFSSPVPSSVTLTLSAGRLTEGEESSLNALVVSNGVAVASHPVVFAADIGGAGFVTRGRVASNGQGNAVSSFKAARVDRNTTVTITATAANLGGSADSKSLVVYPPPIFSDWDGPGIDLPNADIVISTDVEMLGEHQYRYTYTIRSQELRPDTNWMDKALGDFSVPLYNLAASSSGGGVSGSLEAGNTLVRVASTVGGATDFKISVDCECDPGGQTRWVIHESALTASGPPRFRTMMSIGPKVVP